MTNCIPRTPVATWDAQIKSEWSTRVLGGRAVPDGDLMHFLAPVVSAVTFQLEGDFIKHARATGYIDDMCCDDLVARAVSIKAPLKAAQSAKGWVTITGTANATVPNSISFVSSTETGSIELVLDTFATAPTKLSDKGDGSGSAALPVRAVLPGAAGNLDGLSAVTTQSALAEITSDATVTADGIAGGADEETCEELRARLKTVRQNASAIGNLPWYINTLLGFPGVTRVCAQGCGCTDCCSNVYQTFYIFMDNTYEDGLPPAATLRSITDWLWGDPMGRGFGKAMFGQMGQLLTPKICAANVNVSGFEGVGPDKQEKLSSAFADYFANRVCVGGTICKPDLNNVVSATFPGACFRDVSITGDCVTSINSGRDFQIACGQFPKLGTLQFVGA